MFDSYSFIQVDIITEFIKVIEKSFWVSCERARKRKMFKNANSVFDVPRILIISQSECV